MIRSLCAKCGSPAVDDPPDKLTCYWWIGCDGPRGCSWFCADTEKEATLGWNAAQAALADLAKQGTSACTESKK